MSDTGWVSPGTVVNDSSVGTDAWSNPDNAKTSNNSRAEFLSSFPPGTSYYLKATNFGLSVPAGATIDGIEVQVEKLAELADDVSEENVKLIDELGTAVGDNKAKGGYWSTSEGYVTYGGSSDLWSNTWSETDVNDSDFGVAINVTAEYTAYIDHIQIKVYYTESGTPTVGVKYPLPAFKRS
jgi:hypothetical protein